MSGRRVRARDTARRQGAALAGLTLLAAAALAGCSGTSGVPVLGSNDSPSSGPRVSNAQVSVNLPGKGPVPVDRLVTVRVHGGSLRHVSFTTAKRQHVPGRLSSSRTTWTAASRLEPGTRYRLTGLAVDDQGVKKRIQRSFRTVNLTLDQQTYPSIAPLQGETVGVGMPVIVTFDVAVSNRAEIERHLSVHTSPSQPGSWHWISDHEVHWRPRTYWKPGSNVSVHADINGVNAGNGIFGQTDNSASFHIGDAIMMKIDMTAHHMRVLDNGRLLRTIPVTGGKPGFDTRSGIKVIIEKSRTQRMNAATIGIKPGDPNYYNIPDVHYAQRVTYSGEFLHAAPWSVSSQGLANVSHGCVGMSTDNAAWLYGLTHDRGDVVDVTGTNRSMEPTNGYGDWNIPWRDYRAGSALH